MARWRLTQPHYLNVLIDGEPAQWEYKEVNRTSGKAARKVYNVPMLLDPREPSDHNHPGEIIVAQGKNQNPKDIIFMGEPTPDMEPLDDDAQAITDKYKGKWSHPIESLPADGYAGAMFVDFQRQIAELLARVPTAAAASPVSAAGVDPADFAKLQEQVAELMAQNQELKAAAAKPGRRTA